MYIKLDKKLIVDIEKIHLMTNSKVESSYEDLKVNISKIPTALKFFQRIDIEELHIDGNDFKILLDDDHLYLDNKFVNISSKYAVAGNNVTLDLYSLYLKDLDLMLRGKIKLDYYKEIINFFGNYLYKEKIEGEINTQFTKEYIDFFVNTKEVKNIKFLKDFFRLDKIAEAWMYDNVTGKMKLDYLYGKLDTTTFEPVLNSIEGEATIQDAKIHFHKKTAPVKTSSLKLHYKNDTLFFNMTKPTYKKMSIEGSSVAIYNLSSAKKGRVDVNIKHTGILNQVILEILNAFNITLPLKQLDGKTKAAVYLKIPYNAPLETYGTFKAKKANFKINSFPFYTQKAFVELKNHEVIIKKSHFKHKKMLDSTVDLVINTKTLEASGNATIKSFLIQNKNNKIAEIKNLKTPINLTFKGNSTININKLNTKIVIMPKTTDVYIKKLQTIYPYSPLLKEIDIKKGQLKIAIVDESNITFWADLKELSLPFKREGQEIKQLEIDGKIEGENVHIVSKKKDILIDVTDEIYLTLNALDVYKPKEDNQQKIEKLNLILIDSNLHIDDNVFSVRDIRAKIENNKVKFEGLVDKLVLPLSIQGEKLDTLQLKGNVVDSTVSFETLDKKLKFYMLDENTVELTIKGIDLHYDTEASNSAFENLVVNGEDSKIIINDKFHVLATKYNFLSNNMLGTSFDLTHNKTTMKYLKDSEGKLTIEAKKVSDVFINRFFDKDFIEDGTLDVNATGKDDVVTGKMIFHDNKIKNLAILNNVITLVNTTPALINPLLAIPAIFGAVTNKGFNLNGYRVVDGYVDFAYNFDKKYLNMHKIFTKGSSVDFDGFATMNFEHNIVNSDINLIFMKDYSKIVGAVPGLGYIFLGDDKKVATKVNITGKIDDPKIETNILKDSASAPLDIIKRIITLPFKPFIDADKKNKEKKRKEEELKRKEKAKIDELKKEEPKKSE